MYQNISPIIYFNSVEILGPLEQTILIKTSGGESRIKEEAACVRFQAYATTIVSYLHGW